MSKKRDTVAAIAIVEGFHSGPSAPQLPSKFLEDHGLGRKDLCRLAASCCNSLTYMHEQPGCRTGAPRTALRVLLINALLCDTLQSMLTGGRTRRVNVNVNVKCEM